MSYPARRALESLRVSSLQAIPAAVAFWFIQANASFLWLLGLHDGGSLHGCSDASTEHGCDISSKEMMALARRTR